jgi:hypothetical protein
MPDEGDIETGWERDLLAKAGPTKR